MNKDIGELKIGYIPTQPGYSRSVRKVPSMCMDGKGTTDNDGNIRWLVTEVGNICWLACWELFFPL
jgi:hypothetical protein